MVHHGADGVPWTADASMLASGEVCGALARRRSATRNGYRQKRHYLTSDLVGELSTVRLKAALSLSARLAWS